MKLRVYAMLLLVALFLVGCNKTSETTTTTITTQADITDCEYEFNPIYGTEIEMNQIRVPYSQVLSNPQNFICPCKETDENALVVSDSELKSHQVFFDFDAIYPVEYLEITKYSGSEYQAVSSLSIEISIDGVRFDRIFDNITLEDGLNQLDFDNQLVKSIKFVFLDENQDMALQDVRAKLGEGFIIKEELSLSALFLRTSGWTGADGIFTFDLNNGGDTIGIDHDVTAFLFSDTFIGSVNSDTMSRINPSIINNSFGYYDTSSGDIGADALSFAYREDDGVFESVLLPDSYLGHRARNLLDGDGLTISYDQSGLLTNEDEGTMWLSNDLHSELLIDLKDVEDLGSLVLWNYNANSTYGVKEFELYTSDDQTSYSLIGTYSLNQASGNVDEPYTREIDLSTFHARYLKLVVTDTYSMESVGLGKVLIINSTGNPLFGEITATSENLDITANEESARLWLQDGVVIDDKVYLFPLLIKDYLTYFKVHNVGLVSMDIVENRFDYENAEYYNTPLMTLTDDGGEIYFGAGVMDNRDIDGYIYVYGYKDANGRHLLVSRVTEEDFLNFNAWEYWDGTGWSHDIKEADGIYEGVSAELSVTKINSGQYEGKYMLLYMVDTTSGYIAYSISDNPWGAFGESNIIFHTLENTMYSGAFTYNAKLHPSLSSSGMWIVSYNVNTTSLSAYANARIYYPRFLSITEVTKNEVES